MLHFAVKAKETRRQKLNGKKLLHLGQNKKKNLIHMIIIVKLVIDEKEHSDWFLDQSTFSNTDS